VAISVAELLEAEPAKDEAAEAERFEKWWRGGLGVVVVAEDRTGLLLAVTDAIAAVDTAVITDGRGWVANDRAFINLVVSTPRGGAAALRRVAENVRRLKDVPGFQHLVDRFETLVVRGPDRPGLVRDVCRMLADRGANARRFELAPRIEMPPDAADVFEALAVATPEFELTLDVELISRSDAHLDALQDEIRALQAPRPITCERLARG
jgi:predicted amino acid-binding ACT domain protein